VCAVGMYAGLDIIRASLAHPEEGVRLNHPRTVWRDCTMLCRSDHIVSLEFCAHPTRDCVARVTPAEYVLDVWYHHSRRCWQNAVVNGEQGTLSLYDAAVVAIPRSRGV